MMFLRKLSSRIARPVMPDDQESEYLPTQAIADFLATEGKVHLDGILYPSVQVDDAGLNVVLFHKSSRCKKLDIPDGTEIHAYTNTSSEDGPEPDYTVYEEIPSPEDSEKDKIRSYVDIDHLQWENSPDHDDRPETLAVNPDSMTVHLANAVKISTIEFKVSRHRWTKVEPEF